MSGHYKIIVVGAGIAGLATAVALGRNGHQVTVLESRPELGEIGAGIQIPPNACRILFSWGLRKELEEKSDSSKGILVKRSANGELLCTLKQAITVGQEHLPNWSIYRRDYQQVLYDAARRLGVEVKFGVTVEKPNELDADLVVLADGGVGSKTRKYILGPQEPSAVIGRNAYRVLIPREEMMKDTATTHLMTNGYQHMWAGPERYIMGYPIVQDKYFYMVLLHPGEAAPGNWNRPGEVDQMRREFSDFEPLVRRLLEKANSCTDWTLGRLPALPTWTAYDGRILLVGDAAHATTPDYAQGAAMCVEDAAVLAVCLARAKSVRDATLAFQTLRKERTETIQQASWENSIRFTLPDGPEQEERDRIYRLTSNIEQSKERPAAMDVQQSFRAWVTGFNVVEQALEFWNAESGKT